MSDKGQEATLFGHPAGLFTLFFAEMWERFSYYGMRALLLFYMIKGFLGFNDSRAYGVYGAYTALVYATPFIGGVLADRLLGARRAVIIGGVLMAAGHLLMMFEVSWAFFTALALLIVGNGFFKPNISTIVGGLYPPGSPKKDGGFTLFYMGINLGAAMSPLLCGYIGETYGWHYGFGLATFGMLAGLAVFTAPRPIAQGLVLVGALGAATALFMFQNNAYQLAVNSVVAIAMVIAGGIGVVALQRGGVPRDAGLCPDPVKLKAEGWKVYASIAVAVPILAVLVQRSAWAGYLLMVFGALAFSWLIMQALKREKVARERLYVALILMFFSMMFWAFFEQAGSSVNNFTDRNVDRVLEDSTSTAVTETQVGQVVSLNMNQEQVGYSVMLDQNQLYAMLRPSLTNLPAKRLLPYSKAKLSNMPLSMSKEEQRSAVPADKTVSDEELPKFIGELRDERTREALGLEKTIYDEMNTDKQMLAVHEKLSGKALPEDLETLKSQAKTELGMTDEELDDIRAVDDLQRRLAHVPLGLTNDGLKAMSADELRSLAGLLLDWHFDGNSLLVTINVRDELRDKDNEKVDWKVAPEHVGMTIGGAEVPASIFQSVNPIFIILLAPFFSALWGRLAGMGMEPSTPVKFALGVTQLGLGFGCLWMGAQTADQGGMVWVSWLLLAYLLQTTGELCLSPVGLSMVTKLSPVDIVSTVMGAWFMATAFSNYLAGMIATLTGVSHGEDSSLIPAPIDTVHVYGDVFGKIALTAVFVGLLCFAIAPILKRWMHEGVEEPPVVPAPTAEEQ